MFFVVLLLCMSLTVDAALEDTPDVYGPDGEALARLASTYPSLGWNSSQKPCKWHGVGCNSASGRVEFLWLQEMQLAGELSADFGELGALQVLWLQGNALAGSVPESMAKLRALTSLNLSDNRLAGALPKFVLNLPRLEMLWASQNAELGGNLPAIRAPTESPLRIVDLHACSFDGELHSSYLQLPLVEELRFDSNRLVGALPAGDDLVGVAVNLQRLLVSDNCIEGQITDAVASLPKLVDFRAAKNRLSGPLPAFRGFLSHLDVANNALSGPLPSSLCVEHSLEYVAVHSNRFDGAIPPCLARLGALSTLLAHSNALSGAIPEFSPQRVAHLRLHNNNALDFANASPALLAHISANLHPSLVANIVGAQRANIAAQLLDAVRQPTPLIFAACVGALALGLLAIIYLLRALRYIVCCRCFRSKYKYTLAKK
jgi:Leucine rich repeat N-terminal domain